MLRNLICGKRNRSAVYCELDDEPDALTRVHRREALGLIGSEHIGDLDRATKE